MTDRASRQAREALQTWLDEIHLTTSEREMERVSSFRRILWWVKGVNYDPSAGDFVRVLRVLDGEIAVRLEFSGIEVTTVAHDGDKFIYINRGKTFVEECDEEDLNNMIMNCLRDDGVRLLRSTDPELPGAVQEAMEGSG